MTVIDRLTSRFKRCLEYFAILRPTFLFAAVIVLLPLTAIPGAPLRSMLGNIFVDYTFWEGFWFACTLLSAVWALMVTAGISLDNERNRPDAWVYTPERREDRRVTIPLRTVSTFLWFTALALPGAAAVVATAASPAAAALGFAAGAVVAFLGMDAAISFIHLTYWHLRVLPWEPLLSRAINATLAPGIVRRLAWLPDRFVAVVTWAARLLRLPDTFFERTRDSVRLTGDHAFAAWNLTVMLLVYLCLYLWLYPGGLFASAREMLPPAGFLYLLIVFLIYLASLLWIRFRRYRVSLYVFALWLVAVNLFLDAGFAGKSGESWILGSPVHTYDVYEIDPARAKASFVDTAEVIEPLASVRPANGGKPTLIVVAASGGGILAAGWTTKVLTELHRAYPDLRRELRFISSVSGGSVGAAHYVAALDDNGADLDDASLCCITEQSMSSSLSSTAYGLTFPDLHRLLLPIRVPKFDRGRLLEDRWRHAASACEPPALKQQETAERLPGGSAGNGSESFMMAELAPGIRKGTKPAVVFNATVLETGERIGITPLRYLRRADGVNLLSEWSGWKPSDQPLPPRRNGARTLSELLGKSNQFTIDLWTAARLSATFSYVSPAARAAIDCSDQRWPCRTNGGFDEAYAKLHVIDGGYHENFGVASALDWLTVVARYCDNNDCPFGRIALIEIRAKPETITSDAQNEWSAAWLGPPSGLLNSWGLAQTHSNDTAVERMIRSLKERYPLESFVFEPERRELAALPKMDWCKGDKDANGCCCRRCCEATAIEDREFPLSWHLSRAQKQMIYRFWRDPQNQCVARAFLRFVRCGDAAAPCPQVDDSPSCSTGTVEGAVADEKRCAAARAVAEGR